MNFLKNILSTLIGLFLFSLIAVFLVVGIVSSLSESEKYVLEDNSILHLKLNKPVTEQEIDNPLEELGAFGESSSIGLNKLKEAINNASTDDQIKGIYLEVEYFFGGMATLSEVRYELEQFKKSGKFIYAYAEYYTEGAYYLASIADKIYLNPAGQLELNGLNANVTFYKGMFDKFGIEPQIFRVGEYKSAVEPYIRKDLSPENELQLTELLNGLNNTMLSDISASRGIELSVLKEMSTKMTVREAADAMEQKLIDEIVYEDEFLANLNSAAGVDEPQLVSYKNYKNTFSNYKSTTNKIAVIVAEGDIVMGKGDENTVGSDKFAKLIREARKDKSVKAIVIRVNSLGGVFLASDVMWREIELAKKEKPVIASMGDYATSGGYYLAMPCDTIIAQPNTITGSIGIFGMLFNFSELLEDRIGITHDEVATGDYSGMLTVTRSLTDAEKSIFQKSLEKNYDTFIAKAAEGRGMAIDDIQKVASGRVWTGVLAKDNGLVDLLGNYDDAIRIAAEKAGITEDYKVRYYPESKPFFEKLIEDLEGQAKASIVKSEAGELYPYIESLKKIKHLEGAQARFSLEMEIN
ncbi:MAG: signal peptide peptidase SppA [Fulvivirga sp.]|uniref:signal peptide peptidase SppA n=1 Tax=Fulvivirga sp. TaxID=1931237 RepID=UPI0032EF7B39